VWIIGTHCDEPEATGLSAFDSINSLDDEPVIQQQPEMQKLQLARTKGLLEARWLILTLLLVFVGFAWLVWPTRYRYDRMGNIPVRIDRLSGRADGLYSSGWSPLENAAAASEREELPPPKLARLDGRCSIDSINWINCEIYNGSDWIVDEVTIGLAAVDINGASINRNYKLMPSAVYGAPMESSLFHAALGFQPTSVPWSWHIVKATGHKP
jgi:hypothetical protein